MLHSYFFFYAFAVYSLLYSVWTLRDAVDQENVVVLLQTAERKRRGLKPIFIQRDVGESRSESACLIAIQPF